MLGLRWTRSTYNNLIMWYVYILQCSNNTYYTGCANDLEDRLSRDRKGFIHFAKDKLLF
jgi:putative endonuclease